MYVIKSLDASGSFFTLSCKSGRVNGRPYNISNGLSVCPSAGKMCIFSFTKSMHSGHGLPVSFVAFTNLFFYSPVCPFHKTSSLWVKSAMSL